MTAPPELTEKVAALIRDSLQVELPALDTDLIETGLIDSLALITLITEVEGEFGFELPLEEFEIDSFRSAEKIAAYVAAHDPGGAGG